MGKVIKAPEPLVLQDLSVFLAGSIEMGKAVNWQDRVTNELIHKPVTILNPRRDDWDSSWVQEKENSQFNEQVTWELKAMEQADIIAMYFDPPTKSPITLLEFGLWAKSKKLVLCCPKGFWRKGNVDIVCNRYDVFQVETIEDMITEIKRQVNNYVLMMSPANE